MGRAVNAASRSSGSAHERNHRAPPWYIALTHVYHPQAERKTGRALFPVSLPANPNPVAIKK